MARKKSATHPVPLSPHIDLLTFKSRADWLKGRRRALGGSDAPAVLGVSRWGRTPLKVWLDKTTQEEPSNEQTEWQEWGLRLEKTIAEAFAEKANRELLPMPKHSFMRHTVHDFVGASLDGLQLRSGDKKPGVLELKHDSFGSPDEWQEDVPIDYQVQVQHELLASDLEWGSIAVLFHGSAFRYIDVERNDGFIKKMLAVERRFWEMYVKTGTPPPPSPVDGATLGRLFPKEEEGLCVPLEPREFVGPDGKPFIVDPRELILRHAQLAEIAKVVEQEIEGGKAMLKALVGNAERAVLPNGCYASWKTVGPYPVPARTQQAYRKFNVYVPSKVKAGLPVFKMDSLAGIEPLPALPQETK